MSSRKNILNNVILFAVTILLACFVAYLASNIDTSRAIGYILMWFALGVLISALINSVIHEYGHYIFAKKNNFECVSMKLLFFKIVKVNGRVRFSFSLSEGNELFTEFVPKGTDNIAKRYINVAKGGYIFNLILLILSVIFVCLHSFISSYQLFCFFGAFLPVSIYYYLANALPMISEGDKNDALIVDILKHDTDEGKVIINLLKIFSYLCEGKTPAEIDKSLYFDVPQLAEDNSTYLTLMSAKIDYFLDIDDENGLTETLLRLKSIENLPKLFDNKLICDQLYTTCVYKNQPKLADDLMEDCEAYLNKVQSVYTMRIKIAYLAYVLNDKETSLHFCDALEDLLPTLTVLGERNFEAKLLAKLKTYIESLPDGDNTPENV